MRAIPLLVLSLLLAACAVVTPSASQVVDVYSSASTRPWLEELYNCGIDEKATLNLSPDSPQIHLQLGDEQDWNGSVFQVGSEEIVIAVNLQNPLGSLNSVQAVEIFSGTGNSSLQIWAYAPGEDIQRIFSQAVLNGRSVSSFARLAVDPGHMVEALTADVNAIGFLPRRWMTGELKELFLVGSVPVLALTGAEPEGMVRELIACMQKDVGQ